MDWLCLFLFNLAPIFLLSVLNIQLLFTLRRIVRRDSSASTTTTNVALDEEALQGPAGVSPALSVESVIPSSLTSGRDTREQQPHSAIEPAAATECKCNAFRGCAASVFVHWAPSAGQTSLRMVCPTVRSVLTNPTSPQGMATITTPVLSSIRA